MNPRYVTPHSVGHNPHYLRVNVPREYVEAIAAHLGVSVEELHQNYKLEASYFGSASFVYRFVPKEAETQSLRAEPKESPPPAIPVSASPPVTPPSPTAQPGKPPLEVLEWWEPPTNTVGKPTP